MMDVIESMLRPRAVGVDEINENRARIALEPLERGFGHTLGNALRRVLLSSIPGFAIVKLKLTVYYMSTLQLRDCRKTLLRFS